MVFAGGCLVDVDYSGGAFLCTDNVCNEGFECVMGRCVPNGQDAGGADAPSDGGVALVVPGFNPPVANLELSSMMTGDDDASFTTDRFYVVLNSNRGGVPDIWTSSRAALSAPWATPVRDAELSSAEADSTIAVAGNGLSVLFGSERPGGAGDLDLWLSTRASRSAPWGPPVNLTTLNSPSSDAASWISNDRSQLIFHSNRAGTQDLYIAELDPDLGDYGAPSLIPGLPTADSENSGRFAAGGLVITFHSNSADGMGAADLYSATRASLDEPFGPATPIAGVNSPAADEDAWLSDDLCYLAFASDDADGDHQIFEATCIP